MRYGYRIVASPEGDLKLVASEKGLVAVLWPNDNPARVKLLAPTENTEHLMLVEAARQLNEYFAGERRTFTVALDPKGTAFQKRVWDALLTIPFGETRSYAQIAQRPPTELSAPRTAAILCRSSRLAIGSSAPMAR